MFERGPCATVGGRIAKQPGRVVGDEHHPVHLVRELIGIDVLAEVPLRNGDPHRLSDGVEPIFLQLHEAVANRPRPIVELDRCSHEETAGGEPAPLGPRQPVVEERAHARLAPLGGERWLHRGLDEALGRELDDGEL